MSEKLWTVREVVTWTSQRLGSEGVESSRLDAEVLLAHALGCDRVTLYLDLDRPLESLAEGLMLGVQSAVDRGRRQLEPVQSTRCREYAFNPGGP